MPYHDIELTEEDQEFLHEYFQHYGVKGMKWGVRKARERTSQARSRREAAAKKINARLPDRAVRLANKLGMYEYTEERGKFTNKKDVLNFRAKVRDTLASRQEKGAKAIRKDADSFKKAADDLDAGKPTTFKEKFLRGKTSKQMKEMAALEENPTKAKKMSDRADAMAKKNLTTSKEFRDIAKALDGEANDWSQSAAKNRARAQEHRDNAKRIWGPDRPKKIKQEYDPNVLVQELDTQVADYYRDGEKFKALAEEHRKLSDQQAHISHQMMKKYMTELDKVDGVETAAATNYLRAGTMAFDKAEESSEKWAEFIERSEEAFATAETLAMEVQVLHEQIDAHREYDAAIADQVRHSHFETAMQAAKDQRAAADRVEVSRTMPLTDTELVTVVNREGDAFRQALEVIGDYVATSEPGRERKKLEEFQREGEHILVHGFNRNDVRRKSLTIAQMMRTAANLFDLNADSLL